MKVKEGWPGSCARYSEVGWFLEDFNEPPTDQRVERGARDIEGLKRCDLDFASCGSEGFDEDALIFVELAIGGFQVSRFDGAGGVLRRGDIFAEDPFFSHHAREHGFGDAGGRAKRFFSYDGLSG